MSLRLSEKWFRRALWLISISFALFLIQLGGLVVSDLPMVPAAPTLTTFLDASQADKVKASIDLAQTTIKAGDATLAAQNLQLQLKQNNYLSARDSFSNWLSTRQATELTDQNQELILRTRVLDGLKTEELAAQQALSTTKQNNLAAKQRLVTDQAAYDQLLQNAAKKLNSVQHREELRVFAIRLALTLPLLLIAGWLFTKKRKGLYWPFVWGFVFFAVYTFFVELVPYLPYYGGYVRYSVGILITLLLGRYLIKALQRYLDAKKSEERLPEQERHQVLSYELAQSRLAKRICPGCERPVDLEDPTRDFCMHCGICLFNTCAKCQIRKNAFAHYCHHCGCGA